MAPAGPYKLVTVNTVPERAKIIIGRVVEASKETYTIDYVANSERIDDVKAMCEKIQPDILFCASMWTPEESDKIQAIAKEAVPGITTMALPQGLQVEKGPDGVFIYIMEQLPELIGSSGRITCIDDVVRIYMTHHG